MQRFKKYVGREVSLANVKDSARLSAFGMTCRYLPDPPEDYDEFEFVSDFGGGKENLGFMVTIELMKIKKLLFGMISPEDPDAVRPLTEVEMEELLNSRGDQLVSFVEYITA
jgi:hypothetical protein